MAQRGTGVAIAAASAIAFGVSGPFAKSLTESGWSPEGAVLARIVGGAIFLIPLVVLVRRDSIRDLRRAPATVLLYGIVAVAGVQVCFFNAIQHLSVGVALLLEYLAPVLVIGWVWMSTRRRPAVWTLVGAAVALVGAAVVLDVGSGVAVSLTGVAWGLAAAVCLSVYFVVSAQSASGTGRAPVDPLVLAAAGLTVGALAVGLLAVVGVVPVRAGTGSVELAGTSMSWWIAVLALAFVSTAVAYVLGIVGSRMLGASTASIVALIEVVCAVVAARILLGESITGMQMIGGGAIVLGVALVQLKPSVPAGMAADPAIVPAP